MALGDKVGVVVRRGRTRLLSPDTVADGLGAEAARHHPRRSLTGPGCGARGAASPITACADGGGLPRGARPAGRSRGTVMGVIDFDSRRDHGPRVGAGEFDGADLEPIRDRLATLGRPHTPADVADAMRAEGLVVSDSSVIETVESLRRNSIGAESAGRAAAVAGRHRCPGQRAGSGVRRSRRRARADRRTVRLGRGGAPPCPTTGCLGGPSTGRFVAVRRRAARRRLPGPRRTGCGCGTGHLHLAPGAGHPHVLSR